MNAPTLLWLRQDLRLHDQPALAAAAHAGPVIPVYILDDDARANGGSAGRNGGGCITVSLHWPRA